MEKSLFWIKIVRKGATMVASLVLFVGILLDLIFRYLGISSLIGYKIFAAGMIVFGVIFGLSVAVTFLADKLKNQQNKDLPAKKEESTEKTEKKFKLFEFLYKYENTIKLFFYALGFFLAVYFAYSILSTDLYWTIYYFICLFLWTMAILAFMELFYSKDKKTFITFGVILGISLVLLIWYTVLAHTIFFVATAKPNLKLMDILLLITLFLMTVLYLIIVSENQISKVKHTRNCGVGLILLCAGVCMYFVQSIAAFILKKWDTTADLRDRVQYLLKPMNICMYIIIAIVIVAMVNVALNTTHYIKTKNWLGLVDVLASFVCVVLCLVGILAFANFIAYLK